ARNLGFVPGENDIVVTHYEVYGDSVVVLEGSVDRNESSQYAFEVLIDLNDPREVLAFVPSETIQDPSLDPSFRTLEAINQRIEALGGNPSLDSDPDEDSTISVPVIEDAITP